MAEMASLERTADVLLEHRARQASRSEFLADKQQTIERTLRDQTFRMRDVAFQLRRKQTDLQAAVEDGRRKDRECTQHRLRLDGALTVVEHAQESATCNASAAAAAVHECGAAPQSAVWLLGRLRQSSRLLRSQPEVLKSLREVSHLAELELELKTVSVLPARLAATAAEFSLVEGSLKEKVETLQQCMSVVSDKKTECEARRRSAQLTLKNTIAQLEASVEKQKQQINDAAQCEREMTAASESLAASELELQRLQAALQRQGGAAERYKERVTADTENLRTITAAGAQVRQTIQAAFATLEAETGAKSAETVALQHQHDATKTAISAAVQAQLIDAAKAKAIAALHAAVRSSVAAHREAEIAAEEKLKAQLSSERTLSAELEHATALHEAAVALATKASALRRAESLGRAELAEIWERHLHLCRAAEQGERRCWAAVAEDAAFLAQQEAEQRHTITTGFHRQLNALTEAIHSSHKPQPTTPPSHDAMENVGRRTVPQVISLPAEGQSLPAGPAAKARPRYKPATRANPLPVPPPPQKRARDHEESPRDREGAGTKHRQGHDSQSLGRVVLREQHQLSATSDGSWSVLGSPNHQPTASVDGLPPPSAAGTQVGRECPPPANRRSPPPKDPSRFRSRKPGVPMTTGIEQSPTKLATRTRIAAPAVSTSSLTRAWLTAQSQAASPSQAEKTCFEPPAPIKVGSTVPGLPGPLHSNANAAKPKATHSKRRLVAKGDGSLFHVDSLF